MASRRYSTTATPILQHNSEVCQWEKIMSIAAVVRIGVGSAVMDPANCMPAITSLM